MTLDSLSVQLDECLNECLAMLEGKGLTHITSKIAEAQRRLHQPMQLAIIGRISSSKSTLVNAILGEAEVVRTGQLEETFNVSWLKYGDAGTDIRVVFKDGSVREVPKKDWASWTSHQIKNNLKVNVRYIEVFFPNEILKSINIIDTPGLDALSEIDSKNTIDFLKTVHPDAVVMMFTKSIAEKTLDILQDFQSSGIGTFRLNPMNAVGVLSKIDLNWSSFSSSKDIIKESERVITTTLYDKYPEVRRALFSILPVSALLGLGASLLNEDDLIVVNELSKKDDCVLMEMLSSPDFLLDPSYNTGIRLDVLKTLYDKYSLFGIYLLTDAYKHGSRSLELLRALLKKRSGFSKLMSVLLSHFGERASLIKCQNSINALIAACEREMTRANVRQADSVSRVSKRILTFMLSQNDYAQWEVLNKLYRGEIAVDEETENELKNVCGENGNTIWERAGLKPDISYSDLVNYINGRALHWNKEYNMFSVIDPGQAAVCKVIASSYNRMHHQLVKVMAETRDAINVMENAKIYFGDINIKDFVL